MGADGKAEDVVFRPDGNEAQGGIAACSSEAGLETPGRHRADPRVGLQRHRRGHATLQLDAEGKRTRPGRNRRGHVIHGS